jgi:hypothetical protein
LQAVQHLLRLHVLQQIAVGPGAQRGDQIFGLIGNRDHHHARVEIAGLDLLQHVESAHVLHVQVQQQQIRAQFFDQFDAVAAA